MCWISKLFPLQADFNYDSHYWTNKETYAVEDELEGLTEKQTKLASYWNTPFDKICLGMKVNNVTKWIVIDHKASSLFNVIADGVFKKTYVGKDKWLSLMDGSSLQTRCNREGFNINIRYYALGYYSLLWLKVRIGIIANDHSNCWSSNSYIGFGTSARGCSGETRKTTCGNIAYCNRLNNKNTAAFGYIFVQ